MVPFMIFMPVIGMPCPAGVSVAGGVIAASWNAIVLRLLGDALLLFIEPGDRLNELAVAQRLADEE